jgi:hypothetical protein
MLDIARVAPVASVGHVTCGGRRDEGHPAHSFPAGGAALRMRAERLGVEIAVDDVLPAVT